MKKKLQERIVFNPTRQPIKCHVGAKEVITRSGKYAHFCYEWDDMLIDETDKEFEVCQCGKPNPRT